MLLCLRPLYRLRIIMLLFLPGNLSFQTTGISLWRSVVSMMSDECELATEGTIPCNSLYRPSPSVWTVFGELASKTGASNLGQGFPDWDPPEFVLDSLRLAVDTKFHQYTRPAGHPPLVEHLASRYSTHLNRNIDPFNEIAVTVGASQSLYVALTTFLRPTDEIIIFEPFFDLYLKQVKLTGGTPKFVTLGGNAATLADPWALDVDALKRAVTPKSRILLLNSPHNPSGKVFTLAELEAIAEIVRENPNLIVISDEVYKFCVYDPLEEGDPSVRGHYHFARLPGMWDRTITLSSCGKTFSVTGWQVGWLVAPQKFIRPIQDLLPCVQFCAATPIQHALTHALQIADNPYKGHTNYYEWMRMQFQSKRTILEEGLLSVGIQPLPSNGGFFLMGKLPSHLIFPNDPHCDEPYDWRYCRLLATDYGVIGIPTSSFFSDGSLYASELGPMARFAFCKRDVTMREATQRLISKAKTIPAAAF